MWLWLETTNVDRENNIIWWQGSLIFDLLFFQLRQKDAGWFVSSQIFKPFGFGRKSCQKLLFHSTCPYKNPNSMLSAVFCHFTSPLHCTHASRDEGSRQYASDSIECYTHSGFLHGYNGCAVLVALFKQLWLPGEDIQRKIRQGMRYVRRL